MDWQPIESAPKDGTRILLHMDGTDEPSPAVGEWGMDFWMKKNWCMEAGDYWPGATHWAPLPAPPA